ncbi:MAG: hypothetical protein WA624_20700 [Methylocella sp.]
MIGKLITGILWVIFIVGLSAPPLYAYRANNIKGAINIANVVRDTQLLLSLSGFYAGPLDGQCNAQTREAIEKYINKTDGVLIDKSPDIRCNVESLDRVRNGLSLALTTTGTSQKAATPRTSEINDKFSDEVDEIKASIRNTNAALKGITDGFATNFLNQYNGLASTGMTIFITGISVTIAIIALVSNLLRDFIAKSVDASHKKFLDESTAMLREAKTAVLEEAKSQSTTILQQGKTEVSNTAALAHGALATQIYARLGGRILYSQIINFQRC